MVHAPSSNVWYGMSLFTIQNGYVRQSALTFTQQVEPL